MTTFDTSILDDGEPTDHNVDRIKDALSECINDTIDESCTFADLAYALIEILAHGPAGKNDPYWHAFIQNAITETILSIRTEEDEVTLQ